MTEYQLHLQIIAYLQARLPAGSVIHHRPDLELFVSKTWWRPKVTWSPIFIEIKTKTGRLSENQKEVHRELRQADCHVVTVKSVEEVETFINTLLENRSDK